MQSITGLPGNITWKAVLAAVLPTLGGFVAVLVQWVASGEFDRSELATAVGALIAAVLAFAGAYAGQPGVPVARANEELDLHDAPGA